MDAVVSCPVSTSRPLCGPGVGSPAACPLVADAAGAPLLDGVRLAVLSPELGRELAAVGKLSFRCTGLCMYPAIRPGDVLRLAERECGDVAVGDVAVFRREGALFGHRVIESGLDERGHFVVTRPDSAGAGDDGKTFAGDLVGVVDWIERRGARIGLPPAVSTGAARWRLYLVLAADAVRTRSRAVVVRAIGAVQALPAYGAVARRVLAHRQMAPRLLVRLPLGAGGLAALERTIPFGDLEPSELGWLGEPLSFTLAAHVGPGARPAAAARFTCLAGDCELKGWWMDRPEVRLRYRGLGLERLLAQAAASLLRRTGATRLHSCAPDGSASLYIDLTGASA